MRRLRSLSAVPELQAGSAVTVGVFDGVHRGHQQLLGRTVLAARRHGIPSAAVTFDPHPLHTLRPDAAPVLLGSLEQRVRLLESHGIDRVVVLRFDDDLAALPADDFVETLLADRLHARHVTVGSGFGFGRGGRGDVPLLEELGRRWGFVVDEVPPVSDFGDPQTRVSSTLVRRLVVEGRVETAAVVLGRPHRVIGRVVDTAVGPSPSNLIRLQPAVGLALPAVGRYAATLVGLPGIPGELVVGEPDGDGSVGGCPVWFRGRAATSLMRVGETSEVSVHRLLDRAPGCDGPVGAVGAAGAAGAVSPPRISVRSCG